jgi:hypothetical protein
MKLCKLLLATVGAAMLLCALVGNASARNLSTTNQNFRIPFRAVSFQGAFANITCQITIEGSLHGRTIPKVLGTLVGYITRADLGPCAEGSASIQRDTLPWHIRYLSFTGTLPDITAIRVNIIDVGFRARETFAACLARSTAANPVIGTLNRDVASRAITTAELGGVLPTDCGINATFSSDRAPVTLLNTTTRITVTLI